MVISNKFYSVELSDSNGTVTAYSSAKQKFIKQSGNLRALSLFEHTMSQNIIKQIAVKNVNTNDCNKNLFIST